MKPAKPAPVLDRLMTPLWGVPHTPETARRLLTLKADPTVQARVEELADRNTAGDLTPEELAEYRNYVSFGTFVALLKSKARQILANN